MKEKRRKLDKSVELLSKKGVEWLVLNPVDVNRTHGIQINDHKLPKSLKELQESGEKVYPKTSRNVALANRLNPEILNCKKHIILFSTKDPTA